MTSRKPTKINQVLQKWPRGTVATQKWLNRMGFSSKLANWHVKSGWLVRFGARAFSQAGDSVNWLGGLYALQTQLGISIHVGARTALELYGRSHFVPMAREKSVILISDQTEQLPAWFRNHKWEADLEHSCLSLFKQIPDKAVTKLNCGGFKVIMSSAERAIMEQMCKARGNADIMHAYQLMEGLSTLRPDLVQELLENCRSIKVKRVFLWSAEIAGHAWFERLESSRVDLGKGKRQIYKGGQFNKKYQITVPPLTELPGV